MEKDKNKTKTDNKEAGMKGQSSIIKKADIIMLLLLVAAGMLGYFGLKAAMKKGGSVKVSIDGKVVETISLDDDGEYRIEVEGGYNLLIIKDGEAYLKEADCPDKVCVHQKKIRYKGETIVCLPNRVVVSIEGGGEGEVDAVSR